MIVAFPTESFFALGVDARDVKAIKQLFRVKHREKGKPVALVAASLAQVKKFFVMSKTDEQLAKKHWPGALTILLKPKRAIAARALAPLSRGGEKGGQGARLIGVRIPAHAVARHLALEIGAPITATSANISGQPATKSARKVKRDFPDILIVAGRCGRQTKPSTIVQIIGSHIKIIRQGSVHI